MTVITHRTTETTHSVSRHVPGPLHATLLGGTVPLFLGALLSDLAYLRSYHVQWSNFAAWLIAGGLLFGGLAMFFALVNLARARIKTGRPLVYLLLLMATWLLGFIASLEHAKDAWATMPQGLVLSALVTLLAGAASWVGLSGLRAGGEA